MPGFEIFGKEEKKHVDDVMENGILFRYGFDNVRNNCWKAKEFEIKLSKKLGIRYSHLCSSGTAALQAMLYACGVRFGDEVIVPPFTFVATIEAIFLVGAIPVFSEIDETLCLSPKSIDNVITNKTKAILPVHMCGAMARIDEINSFCKSKGLILIEDACQAIGGTYKNQALGSFGMAGCFSFDFVKTITCGEGGAVVTNDKDIYLTIDSFTDHGHDHIGSDRGNENHQAIGTNFRISELNAAVGLAQIDKLERILTIQKNNKEIIKDALKSIQKLSMRKIPDEKGDSATFLSFMLPNIDKARKTILELDKAGIDGCFHWFDNNWHYIRQWNHMKSVNLYHPFLKRNNAKLVNYSKISLPKSDLIMGKTISIQIKIGWSKNEVERRADIISSIVKKII